MTDSFRDFSYHSHIEVQHIQVGSWLVTLRRDGEKQMGPRGRVEVRALGAEEAHLDALERSILLEYTGTLEQAQGYAQGIVDTLEWRGCGEG